MMIEYNDSVWKYQFFCLERCERVCMLNGTCCCTLYMNFTCLRLLLSIARNDITILIYFTVIIHIYS